MLTAAVVARISKDKIVIIQVFTMNLAVSVNKDSVRHSASPLERSTRLPVSVSVLQLSGTHADLLMSSTKPTVIVVDLNMDAIQSASPLKRSTRLPVSVSVLQLQGILA